MKKFSYEKEDILKLTTGAYCYYPSVRILIHPFSIRLVYFFAKLGMHPNLLSTIGIFVSLSCLLFFQSRMYGLSLLFFWGRLVIDYSDGALARYTNKTSKIGYRLEMVSDYGCYLGIWILIALQLNSFYEKLYLLVSCFVYMICVGSYIIPRLGKLKRRATVKQFFMNHGVLIGMGVFTEFEFWALVFFAIGIAPEYIWVLVLLNNLDLIYRIYEILRFYDPSPSPRMIKSHETGMVSEDNLGGRND